jgi:hypothetical protein
MLRKEVAALSKMGGLGIKPLGGGRSATNVITESLGILENLGGVAPLTLRLVKTICLSDSERRSACSYPYVLAHPVAAFLCRHCSVTLAQESASVTVTS